LFLCYNALLKDFLRSRNPDMPTLEVHSFHSLAARIVGPNADLRKLEAGFVDWALGSGDKLPFRHILIDEAQDFTDEWLQALQLARDTDGVFYAFFDRHQLINRDEFPATLDRLECRLVLDTNCRNTRQVARTSLSFMELERSGAFKAIDGPAPRVHIVANEKERLACASEIVKAKLADGEYQPQEIALLVFDSGTHVGAKVEGFHVADRIEDGTICCTSIRRFKGLEAKVVVVFDASTENLATAQHCREFYVGTSRAMHELHVIFQARDEIEIGAFIGAVCERDGRKLRKGLRGLKQLLGAETS
jgi:superfamily I DNA/RNA helicase